MLSILCQNKPLAILHSAIGSSSMKMMLRKLATATYVSTLNFEMVMTYKSQNESVTSCLYPGDPEIWKTDMGPVGAAKAFITAGKLLPLPEWLSASEVASHNQIFDGGGYTGPLNW